MMFKKKTAATVRKGWTSQLDKALDICQISG